MPLSGGSCQITPGGVVSGSGLARALADATMSTEATNNSSGRVDANAALAGFINGLANALVTYLVANAAVSVTITTATAGLQRTPNPNNPNTATLAPAAPVTITGSLT